LVFIAIKFGIVAPGQTRSKLDFGFHIQR